MLTGDPLTSLKILLSYYRRDRKLVEFEKAYGDVSGLTLLANPA
jgi:hypothetical protein